MGESLGEKLGLLGLNGHGKSTLFRILEEKVIPDTSTPPFTFDKNNAEDGGVEEASTAGLSTAEIISRRPAPAVTARTTLCEVQTPTRRSP